MNNGVVRENGRRGRRNINGMRPQMRLEDINFNTIYVNAIPLSEDIQIFGYVTAWKNGEVGYSVLEEASNRPDLSECGVFWMRPEDFVKVFKVYGKRMDNRNDEEAGEKNNDSIFDFRERMKKAVINAVPADMRESITFDNVEVIKINDQKLVGFIIKKGIDGSACPTYYLNDLYEEYIHGRSIKELAKELADSYIFTVSGMNPEMETKMKQDLEQDFDDIRERLAVKVLETWRNREFLKTLPHKDIGNGLAVVFDVQNVISGNDVWRMPVTSTVLEKAGIDEEKLYDIAMGNVNNVDPAVLVSLDRKESEKSIKNLLENGKKIHKRKQMMYVLTNRCNKYGAAALFYPGMQEKIARRIGDSYYAIPTSLHEFVIVPEKSGADMVSLRDKLKDDNRSTVHKEDVLSDNILHYDREWKQLVCVNDMLGTGSGSGQN